MAITGHCLCGAISYETQADPAMAIVCHCDDCQRSSGAAFSVNVVVPRDGLSVSGEPAVFNTTGTDTGKPRDRQFCSTCGSQVFTLLEEMPDVTIIKAGTIDNREIVQPTAEIWTESAQEWRAAQDGERQLMPRGMG